MSSKAKSKTSVRRQGQHPPTAAERRMAQATFLTMFAKSGIVLRAAHASGIHRQTVYDWKRSDPDFAAAYEIAAADADDVIRMEVFRRGMEGWDEDTVTTTVDDHGDIVRIETKTTHHYSDAMLRLIAQSRMSEFRDRLDVTSGDEALGARMIYDRISSDPQATAAACDLLSIIGRDVSASSDAGRTSDAGE
jgi:hypothetical protein